MHRAGRVRHSMRTSLLARAQLVDRWGIALVLGLDLQEVLDSEEALVRLSCVSRVSCVDILAVPELEEVLCESAVLGCGRVASTCAEVVMDVEGEMVDHRRGLREEGFF